jgi:hypothetical protein
MLICEECKDQEAWNRYEKRNGNTVSYVVGQFKYGGGLGDPQKAAVELYSRGLFDDAVSSFSCKSLIDQVHDQEWDLYKGARFEGDYAIVRKK